LIPIDPIFDLLWGECSRSSQFFSAALAGGGVQGGQTIGRSDRISAYPASRPYAPADLAATTYQSLGIDPATEVRDRLNRPVRLCTGEPIAPLFSAARTVS